MGDSLDKTWKDEEERSGERSEEAPFYSSAMAVLSQQDPTLGVPVVGASLEKRDPGQGQILSNC